MKPTSFLALLALTGCFLLRPFRNQGPEPGDLPIGFVAYHASTDYVGDYWETSGSVGAAVFGVLDAPTMGLHPAEALAGAASGCGISSPYPILDRYRSIQGIDQIFYEIDDAQVVPLDASDDGSLWYRQFSDDNPWPPGAVSLLPFELAATTIEVEDLYQIEDPLPVLTGPNLDFPEPPELAARDLVWTWTDDGAFEYVAVRMRYFDDARNLIESRTCVADARDGRLDARADATEAWAQSSVISVEVSTIRSHASFATDDLDALAIVSAGEIGALTPR